MLSILFGSRNAENVLIYIFARQQGYAREIARFFNVDVFGVQNQLEKFEAAGVLFSRKAGRTVLYAFDPRYPFLIELNALLKKALTFYSEDEREKLLMDRRRPRRKGKPA
jgi:hypothetical protein